MDIFLVIVAIILIVLLTRSYKKRNEELTHRVDMLQSEVEHLRGVIFGKPSAAKQQPEPPPNTTVPPELVAEPPKPGVQPPPFVPEAPPIIQPEVKLPPPVFSLRNESSINWERFMGVNLFAWIGGFVLFLAAAFFVKYSIDNNWISPQIRIALGFLLGVALIATGLRLSLKQYPVSVQTLCSTGILILYAVVFASHVFYQFIEITTAFLLMIVVTAAAFMLAVKLDAKVVAILGMLGGFLTPPLLSTGVDNPTALFTYILILDAGLIAIALRKQWSFLVSCAAFGTVMTQIAWTAEFFAVEKAMTPIWTLAASQTLFLLALFAAKKFEKDDNWYVASSLFISFYVICFAFFLLGYPALAAQPTILFAFALISEIGLMAAVAVRPSSQITHMMAGVLIFFLLATWINIYLTDPLLYWTLGILLAFAFAHSFFPLAISRKEKVTRWVHLFPALSMILFLFAMAQFIELSFVFWLAIFLVDVAALYLAIVTASSLSLFGVLLLTLYGVGTWIRQDSVAIGDLYEVLFLIAGFSIFFFISGIFAGKKLKQLSSDLTEQGSIQFVHIPLLSSVLPFFLLMLVIVRLPLIDPTPVFALGFVLIVLILGIWRWLKIDLLPFIALFCSLALELTWYTVRFDANHASTTVIWYFTFYGLFVIFPFVFQKHLQQRTLPWIASALAGPLHFYLFYSVINRGYPNNYMGLLPAVLSLIPLFSVWQRYRALPQTENNFRNVQLAAFGGAALFFITLIFPIQFKKEWVIIGWALEGAALLWLFQKIPHPGLRWIGCLLLAVSFLRLTTDPSILSYYTRSTIKIVNWYLYTYGIVIACLFAGGWLEGKRQERNLRSILYALGTILMFVLLNIEIADYFSDGIHLTFQFSENFARDMTYSIAWAFFAFILLMIGIRKDIKAARYAGIGLVGVTLLKLFFRDLIHLRQLYRVGALVAVAVVLILVSFLYQRAIGRGGGSKTRSVDTFE
jgi:uncharacterized membrane protein